MNLLLVDLDGTIRRCKSNPKGFINVPLDQEIIPEAAAALARCKVNGMTIIGVSNQGGIDAGYKTLGSCIDEMQQTLKLAPQLDGIYFCPSQNGGFVVKVGRSGYIVTATRHTFKDEGITDYRKPSPGMLQLAMLQVNALDTSTLMVGDRPEDSQAAHNAGVAFMRHDAWWQSEVGRTRID